MIKYRVITVNGFCEFPDKNEKCLAFHTQYGIGEIEAIDDTPAWDNAAHCLAIEAAVDEMVSAKLLELNYTNFKGEPSVGDVAAGVADNEAEWHLEAVEVNKWYSAVYAAMYAYAETVTEATALSPVDFIASLPQLNL